MGFIKEFKEFAIKGNAMDLAIGVIIGAAFSKIVDSIVNDLVMPLVGIFFKADFSNLYIPLSDKVPYHLALADAKKLGPVFAWGNFITVALNFLILALIIFIFVRGLNRLRIGHTAKVAQEKAPLPEVTPTEKLLMEIRDSLRK